VSVGAAERIDVEHQQDERQRHDQRLGQEPEPVGHDGREQPSPPRRAVGRARSQVRQHRQEIEQRREHIPALGDPGDRLDAQRVDGEEQRRHGCAERDRALTRLGQAQTEKTKRQQIEQSGVGGVEQDVRQVIAERIHSPDGVVEAEAEPRDGNPVAHDGAREGPADLLPAEAAIEGIVQEVAVVVPEDEAVLQRGREDRDGQRRNGERHDPADQRVELRGADIPLCHEAPAPPQRFRR